MYTRVCDRRKSPRKSCRGTVLVYELTTGQPFEAELIDISRGGVRLALDGRVAADEVVRLFFPHRKCDERYRGRMLLGRVVNRQGRGSGQIVRVAFGWDAEVTGRGRSICKHFRPASIFRRFTDRLSPRVFSAWKRA